jgi:hypothetical protein
MLGSLRADADPRSLRRPCGGAPFAIDQHLRRLLEHAVATPFAVARTALWRPTRGSPAEAFARQVAMYLAHVGLGLTFTTVGACSAATAAPWRMPAPWWRTAATRRRSTARSTCWKAPCVCWHGARREGRGHT